MLIKIIMGQKYIPLVKGNFRMKLIKDLGTRLIKGTWVRYAIFKCPECLQEVERVMKSGLKQKSCGCKGEKNYKHGETKTKLHNVWKDIKQRILNSNNASYKNYGGRGITLCNEWLEFIPFRDWAINNGYAEGLQINRIKNEFGYEPSNCNFVPAKENARNRRGQKIKNIEMSNEIRDLHATGNYTQKELAEKYNVSIGMINHIINNKYWKN